MDIVVASACVHASSMSTMPVRYGPSYTINGLAMGTPLSHLQCNSDVSLIGLKLG